MSVRNHLVRACGSPSRKRVRMMHVLAALDTSSSARGVLDTALHVGRLTGTTVVAVHVRTGAAEPVDMIEARCEEEGVALRVLSGDPGPILISI